MEQGWMPLPRPAGNHLEMDASKSWVHGMSVSHVGATQMPAELGIQGRGVWEELVVSTV